MFSSIQGFQGEDEQPLEIVSSAAMKDILRLTDPPGLFELNLDHNETLRRHGRA